MVRKMSSNPFQKSVHSSHKFHCFWVKFSSWTWQPLKLSLNVADRHVMCKQISPADICPSFTPSPPSKNFPPTVITEILSPKKLVLITHTHTRGCLETAQIDDDPAGSNSSSSRQCQHSSRSHLCVACMLVSQEALELNWQALFWMRWGKRTLDLTRVGAIKKSH